MTNPSDLAALIGSRICHDLISPIGAIGNGVELLMMDGTQKSPEIALISESVAHANARIRFFRVAFGATTPGQRIGAPEATGILADMTRGSRLQVTWDGPADLARAEVKLAFLALLCLESAMPYGGRLKISAGDSWTIRAHAAKWRIEPPLWDPLRQGEVPQAPNPATVHFTLLATDAARAARPLSVGIDDAEITLRF